VNKNRKQLGESWLSLPPTWRLRCTRRRGVRGRHSSASRLTSGLGVDSAVEWSCFSASTGTHTRHMLDAIALSAPTTHASGYSPRIPSGHPHPLSSSSYGSVRAGSPMKSLFTAVYRQDSLAQLAASDCSIALHPARQCREMGLTSSASAAQATNFKEECAAHPRAKLEGDETCGDVSRRFRRDDRP